MPNRILRDGILTSGRVNQLSWPAEVLYRRLMSVVDDYGRYDGRAELLRAHLFPLKISRVSNGDVSSWIAECVKAGLVTAYEVDGKPYLEIIDFRQQIRAQTSKWPEPPPADSTCNQMISSAHVVVSGVGGAVEDGVGDDSCSEPQAATEPDGECEPPALVFPCVGNPKEWPLTHAKVAEYADTYPGIDAMQQARMARQWCVDNPAKRKTAKGMSRFLNRWMQTAQDRGGGGGGGHRNGTQSAEERAKHAAERLKAMSRSSSDAEQ